MSCPGLWHFNFDAQATGCDKPDVPWDAVPRRGWMITGPGAGEDVMNEDHAAGLGVEVHDLAGPRRSSRPIAVHPSFLPIPGRAPHR
jgi:hypothetical protein